MLFVTNVLAETIHVHFICRAHLYCERETAISFTVYTQSGTVSNVSLWP